MDESPASADVKWLKEGPDRHFLSLRSSQYPRMLVISGAAPDALYVQGSIQALSTPQLAMVGSRNPTRSGRDTARQFAEYLARCGLTITSGLAEGIDTASHEGALAAGGITVAVCGTGLDQVYPQQNRSLAEAIVAGGGALV